MSDPKLTPSERLIAEMKAAGLSTEGLQEVEDRLRQPVSQRDLLDSLYRQVEIYTMIGEVLVASAGDDRQKTLGSLNKYLHALKDQLDLTSEITKKALGVSVGDVAGEDDGEQ